MDGPGSLSLRDDAKAAGNSPKRRAQSGEPRRTRPRMSGFAIGSRALDDATTLVVPEGELDLASAPNLKWTLGDVVRKGARDVVLDLTLVTFIDSTALGVLVGFHRTLAPGARLAIIAVEEDVLQIFELTGLDSRFDMFQTLDDALAWLRAGANPAG